MDYISSILSILKAGLSLWADKEAGKYMDEVIKLEQRIIDEKKKPIFVRGMDFKQDYRNDDVIDDCIRRVLLISKHFADSVRGTH